MSAARDDVLYAGLGDLSSRIRTRQLSPVELTEGYLDRLGRLGPRLNALARLTPDLARAQAKEAEAEIARGHYRGPLHGIPYGAKDLLDTAGIATEWGAAPCRGRVPTTDATVVRRLREAGAILLGKLSMVEFAGCVGYRYPDASVDGPGRNPWDSARWTGGSSSGSGAAVAAGLVPFAIGTETWGSILCPSAFCGITGLRPTYGRVSRAGGMVGSYTFDKVGPLARSAADCRIVLQAIAGADPADPTAADRSVDLTPRRRDLKKLRVALVDLDWSVKGAEAEVQTAFHEAVATLRQAGCRVQNAALPDLPVSDLAGVIINAEAMSTFERFYRDGTIRQLKDPYAPDQRDINGAITGADLVKAWRMRRVVQARMSGFFADWDLILTPNFMSVAPPVDRDLVETLPYPDPAGAVGNSCGLPALALPCGSGAHGMPCGFQLMAAPWDEGLLCDVGERYQALTGFHRARPPAFSAA